MAQERLPPAYALIAERWWRPLAQVIAADRRSAGAPLVVGINGGQGSGKSTLCQFLTALLADEGMVAVTVSLDDFYLGRPARQVLARDVHPLLATRGVPGTHDVAALDNAITALAGGGRAILPRFDKAADDRAPETSDAGPCDVILFEGWCVGASAQAPHQLAAPINPLEADEDADGVWRAHVNAQLAGPYAALFARIDLMVALLPPDFASVAANRRLQEEKLAARVGADRVMDAAALARFMSHYQRLTLHMLAEMPARADVVVRLGPAQRILEMVLRAPARSLTT
ncbi:MAG TPA: kinase [Novosphingobium sp.]|nr:kinase [Novosphingobium sp.]